MARTAVPEQSHSFVRSNSERGARKHDAAAPAVSRPERPFEAATHELLGLIEQAVARIEHGAGAEAALRDLSATLLALKVAGQKHQATQLAPAPDGKRKSHERAPGVTHDHGPLDVESL